MADGSSTEASRPRLTLMYNSDNPSCLLRLVGMPPPNIIDTSHTAAPGLASSAESLAFNAMAFPALQPGELAAEKCIDSIDASNEDPFTLDTFESLIRMHADNGKDFILARVVTIDEKERLYYSYYAAHHINKVLFRTQPEEGLLHRMKAKNPMNNMPVVGDVHYYRVRTSDPASNPLLATSRRSTASVKTTNGGIVKPLVSTRTDTVQKQVSQHSLSSGISAPAALSKQSLSAMDDAALSMSSTPRSYTRRASFMAEGALSMSPSVPASADVVIPAADTAATIAEMKKWADELPGIQSTASYTVTNSAPGSPTSAAEPQQLVFTAQYYATDDDYLMRRFVREYFKQNTLNAEDIFLFTLFGGSQSGNSRGAFIAPLVSDPTNPNAVATPMDAAVRQYLVQQQQKRATSASISASTALSLQNPHSADISGGGAAFQSLRTGGGGQQSTPASSANSLWARLRTTIMPATTSDTPPLPGSPASQRSVAGVLRQLFHFRPRQLSEREGVNLNYTSVTGVASPSPTNTIDGYIYGNDNVDVERQMRASRPRQSLRRRVFAWCAAQYQQQPVWLFINVMFLVIIVVGVIIATAFNFHGYSNPS